MKVCNEFRNRLPLFVSGDLEAAETNRIEEHLAACEACRKAVQELRHLQTLMAADTVEVAPHYGSSLVVDIQEQLERRRRQKRQRALWLIPAFASIALLLVLSFTVFSPGPNGDNDFLKDLSQTALYTELTHSGLFDDTFLQTDENNQVWKLETDQSEWNRNAAAYILDEPLDTQLDDYVMATAGLDDDEFEQLLEKIKNEVI